MKYPDDMPPPPPRPADHPQDLPWPPQLPEYPEDSPARLKEESLSAFHYKEAVSFFGSHYIEQLKTRQEIRIFRGDWWMLALFSRCLTIAQISDLALKPDERYAWWNSFVKIVHIDGVQIHLEGARIDGADLTGITLISTFFNNASLQNSRINDSQITNTRLNGAQLNYCEINDSEIWRVDFSNAFMHHSQLRNTKFGKSIFAKTDAIYSVCSGSILTGCTLSSANFSYCKLDRASLNQAALDHSNLANSSCIDANFHNSDLRHSDLSGTIFTRAILSQARLDHADVRGASHILFDQNPAERLHIDGNANDPWSVLRRKYTGPRFVLNLFLSSLFLLPYIIKVFQLNVLAEVYNLFNALAQSSEQLPHVDVVRVWLDTFATGYSDTNAAYAMLGGTRGWQFAAISIMLILYNLIRYFLTVNVASLREAEDRSKITPRLHEYYGPLNPRHPIVLGLNNLQIFCLCFTSWRKCVGRWLKLKPPLHERHFSSLARRLLCSAVAFLISSFLAYCVLQLSISTAALVAALCAIYFCAGRWRIESLETISPIATFGIYRLHILSKYLLLAVAFVLVANILDWLLTTKIPIYYEK